MCMFHTDEGLIYENKKQPSPAPHAATPRSNSSEAKALATAA